MSVPLSFRAILIARSQSLRLHAKTFLLAAHCELSLGQRCTYSWTGTNQKLQPPHSDATATRTAWLSGSRLLNPSQSPSNASSHQSAPIAALTRYCPQTEGKAATQITTPAKALMNLWFHLGASCYVLLAHSSIDIKLGLLSKMAHLVNAIYWTNLW